MTKKEFQKRKTQIRKLYGEGKIDHAQSAALGLIAELHASKDYYFTVDLFRSPFLEPKEYFWTFEVAYALNDSRFYSEAEQIYQQIVEMEPENSAALNNLSNIMKQKGNIDKAFDLIQKAYQINPKDEIIARNYENLLSIVREQEERNQLYKHALIYLPKENEFVIQKLQSFFASAKKDKDFRENLLPIPRWKFKVMMGTDEQKAMSLLEQWLEKGYLRKTGERGNYQEHIYELNPLLFSELPKIKPKKLNQRWIKGLEQFSVQNVSKRISGQYF